jgi:hypothetical protein
VEIKCVVITSLNDLNKYIQDILLIQQSQTELEVNSAIEHVISVIENSRKVICPYFIVGYADGKPVGLLLSRIEKMQIHISLGYFNFPLPEITGSVFIFGGLIESNSLDINEELSLAYISEIRKSFKSMDVDVVQFNCINTESVLYKILKRKPISIFSIYSKTNNHYQFILPVSLEEFYSKKSKHHRKNLLYYSKKLEKDFKSVEFKCFRDEKEINNLLEDVEKIAKKTYQRGIGVGYNRSDITEKRFTLAARNNWLRAYVLYLNSNPVCFQLGFQYKGGYYVQGKGYDPEYRSYRLGTCLFIKMLDDFYKDKNIMLVDFGIGDAEYKDLYGNKQWMECTSLHFRPNLKNILIFIILNSTTALNTFFRNILEKTNMLNKIKKLWRIKKEKV